MKNNKTLAVKLTTYKVENNLSKFFWSDLYSETYFTTPLKVPREVRLISIDEVFRNCPTLAIPAWPVYCANRFWTTNEIRRRAPTTKELSEVIFRIKLLRMNLGNIIPKVLVFNVMFFYWKDSDVKLVKRLNILIKLQKTSFLIRMSIKNNISILIYSFINSKRGTFKNF